MKLYLFTNGKKKNHRLQRDSRPVFQDSHLQQAQEGHHQEGCRNISVVRLRSASGYIQQGQQQIRDILKHS